VDRRDEPRDLHAVGTPDIDDPMSTLDGRILVGSAGLDGRPVGDVVEVGADEEPMVAIAAHDGGIEELQVDEAGVLVYHVTSKEVST
jgi:hypothetical protein